MVRLLVAVLCGGLATPAFGDEEPAAPAVPPAGLGVLVALPGGILPGENAEVRRAVDVYLYDFRPEVDEIGPLPGGMRAQIRRTVEVARTRDVRLAVVLFWSAQTRRRVLTATFIDLRDPDAKPVKFTVDWPHEPDAAFYRLLGLKVRSTLLAIVGAPPKAPRAGAGGRRAGAGDDDDGALRFGVEGLVAGDLAVESRAPVASFGGALRLEYGRWSFGAAVRRSLEERRTFSTTEGDTATTRATAAVGFRVARALERLGFFAEVELGGLHLRTTSRLLASGEAHDHGQWIPLVSFAFLVGYDIGDHVRLRLGPRLDVFMVRGWRTLEGTRVYDTGWVQPGLDLKIMVLF